MRKVFKNILLLMILLITFGYAINLLLTLSIAAFTGELKTALFFTGCVGIGLATLKYSMIYQKRQEDERMELERIRRMSLNGKI